MNLSENGIPGIRNNSAIMRDTVTQPPTTAPRNELMEKLSQEEEPDSEFV